VRADLPQGTHRATQNLKRVPASLHMHGMFKQLHEETLAGCWRSAQRDLLPCWSTTNAYSLQIQNLVTVTTVRLKWINSLRDSCACLPSAPH
jgi:hypothetical protein